MTLGPLRGPFPQAHSSILEWTGIGGLEFAPSKRQCSVAEFLMTISAFYARNNAQKDMAGQSSGVRSYPRLLRFIV
jgi:hypothetical protein